MRLIIVSFIGTVVILAGIIQNVITSGMITRTDFLITDYLTSLRDPAGAKLFSAVTSLASWQVIVGLAVLAAVILWIGKKKKEICYLWLALSAGAILNYFIKALIQRARPPNPVYLESSFSFPSGHALTAMIFYGLITYFISNGLKKRTQKISAIMIGLFIISAVGFSRLYLGVHYLSDVLAGYLLGFLILLIILFIRGLNPKYE